jgi:flavorubredoxin
MEARIVGYGGAFDTHLVNSSLWVSLEGKRYLIDCGHSVFAELVKTGLASEIDIILITHLHDDHVGSLSSYLLYRNIVLGLPIPEIWCPTTAFAEQLTALLSHSQRDISQRAKICAFPRLAHVGFIDTFGLHVPGMITFAFWFQDSQHSLVWSGDLGDGTIIFRKIPEIGLRNPLVLHEMSYHEVHIGHTSYRQLAPYLAEYNVVGYHCDPQKAPADCIIPHVSDRLNLVF